MRRIGTQLIQEKKAQIQREMSESKNGSFAQKELQGRDLLTLLLKANMATDIPDSQRLSDEDVLAREYLSFGSVTSCLTMGPTPSLRGAHVSRSCPLRHVRETDS